MKKAIVIFAVIAFFGVRLAIGLSHSVVWVETDSILYGKELVAVRYDAQIGDTLKVSGTQFQGYEGSKFSEFEHSIGHRAIITKIIGQ